MKLAPLLLALLPLAGCVRSNYFGTRNEARYPSTVVVPEAPFPPRALPMFEGSTGRVLIWTELMQGVFWADVVFLGETHDDAVAHAVQLALVGDTLQIDPHLALSLEMLDRGEQPALDRFLSGAMTRDEFIASMSWKSAAEPDAWRDWYQPIVDEAKRSDAEVIAANAPRRFVRLARTEGWAALEALPPEEQALFSLPRRVADDGPRRRFAEFMLESWAAHAPPPAAPAGAASPGVAPGSDGTAATPIDPAPRSGPTPEQIDAAWRSQSLWDSTMADSIARALGPPWDRTRVIHLVGQFHSDRGGGTVQQLWARRPTARVLTVSLRPRRERELQPEDRGAADVVIYTGWTGRDD